MNKTQLANYFDHTFLKPYATEADLTKLCNEAKEIGAAMVAINTTWTKFCKEQLKGTNVHVGAAISFPLGQAGLASKIAETKIAIEDGADEIDYVIDIGPGAGNLGGKCIAKGTVEEIRNNQNSLTGRMLRESGMARGLADKRRQSSEYIELQHIKENNLKDISVKFRKNVLNCITGVSGSGKSTLVEALLKKYPEIVVAVC